MTKVKKIMIILLSLIFALALSVFVFINQAMFGKLPSGERLERIKKSPNFKDGEFHNISRTPIMADGVSYFSAFSEFIFAEKKRNKPVDAIPSMKTDLLNLNPNENILVWFGHSSYFIQIDGKKILVDPVFRGAASPVSFTTRAFKGTDRYTADDIPEIDYLFITHDHWDHLDYETVTKLKPKIKQIVCGLGTGEHLEYWGFNKKIISENDWYDQVDFGSGFKVFTVPTRHFSGRTFSRNKSLWAAYVLETPTSRLFLGGDGGYDSHFAEIGKRFGEFDLAILENGQYDKNWKYIHSMPNEVLQEAKDLNAKRILPVHSSKFSLSNHDWDEPLIQITKLCSEANLPLITPIIGEKVNLDDSLQKFSEWWKEVR